MKPQRRRPKKKVLPFPSQVPDASALFERGYKESCQENWQQAERYYRAAIKSDPEYTLAYYNLGIMLERQKKFLQAIEAYEKVVELDPPFADAHLNIAELCFSYPDRGRPKALKHYLLYQKYTNGTNRSGIRLAQTQVKRIQMEGFRLLRGKSS